MNRRTEHTKRCTDSQTHHSRIPPPLQYILHYVIMYGKNPRKYYKRGRYAIKRAGISNIWIWDLMSDNSAPVCSWISRRERDRYLLISGDFPPLRHQGENWLVWYPSPSLIWRVMAGGGEKYLIRLDYPRLGCDPLMLRWCHLSKLSK